MGIKNLLQFLHDKTPSVFEHVSLSMYSGTTIAIDIMIYLYKYKHYYKGAWINGFVSLFACLLDANITPLCVFDGRAPVEKIAVRTERRERKRRTEFKLSDISATWETFKNNANMNEVPPSLMVIYNKRVRRLKRVSSPSLADLASAVTTELECLRNTLVSVSHEDMNTLRQYLQSIGVKYLTADGEAEELCAQMCVRGDVRAVMSHDSDVLAYNTPIIIQDINVETKTCTRICIENVLDALELSYAQFLDFCIMCGTDYNQNMLRYGTNRSYNLIRKYKTIEAIAENVGLDIGVLNHIRVRELFSNRIINDRYS